MNPLLIRQFEVGPMENLVYFVGDRFTREVVVVDPAWEVDTIFKKAQEENLKIVGVILTHHHNDHTNGIEELLERTQVPVYVHKLDQKLVTTQTSYLTAVSHADKIKIGSISAELLHTPGHTPGSQCIKIFNQLLTGDTLFVNGCGRCDLPGGNAEQLYDTLTQRVMMLPDETIIWPGHNYAPIASDSLLQQKKTNLYLRMASLSLQDFLKLRIK